MRNTQRRRNHEGSGPRRRLTASVVIGLTALLAGLLFGPMAAPASAAEPGASFAMAMGDDHSCFIGNGGTVVCMGDNSKGQIGNGTRVDAQVPTLVPGISGAVVVTAGQRHTCALLGDGTARCWGDNAYGQLGNGTTVSTNQPVAVNLNSISYLEAGDNHTCAVRTDGTIACWGQNSNGQLGNGTVLDSSNPSTIPGVANAVTVSGGQFHTCSVLNNGNVRCWGKNTSGQLGNGSNTDTASPVFVSNLSNVESVAAGYDSTCAVRTNGDVMCWGANESGQLANSDLSLTRNTPLQIGGVSGRTQVAAGFRYFCAGGSGSAICWGDNTGGQIGNGQAGDNRDGSYRNLDQPTPHTVQLGGVQAVETGDQHTCAITTGGVFCWGDNNDGQFGNGSTNDSYTPLQISVTPGQAGPNPGAPGPVEPGPGDPGPVDPGPGDPGPAQPAGYASFDAMFADPAWSSADADVLRLYNAFFDRNAELQGANYWIGQFRSGTNLDTIAYSFSASQEFQNTYGSVDNSRFLEIVYRNVLGREFDQRGFDYWLNQIQTGQLDRSGVVRWVAANNEFVVANRYGGK